MLVVRIFDYHKATPLVTKSAPFMDCRESNCLASEWRSFLASSTWREQTLPARAETRSRSPSRLNDPRKPFLSRSVVSQPVDRHDIALEALARKRWFSRWSMPLQRGRGAPASTPCNFGSAICISFFFTEHSLRQPKRVGIDSVSKGKSASWQVHWNLGIWICMPKGKGRNWVWRRRLLKVLQKATILVSLAQNLHSWSMVTTSKFINLTISALSEVEGNGVKMWSSICMSYELCDVARDFNARVTDLVGGNWARGSESCEDAFCHGIARRWRKRGGQDTNFLLNESFFPRKKKSRIKEKERNWSRVLDLAPAKLDKIFI